MKGLFVKPADRWDREKKGRDWVLRESTVVLTVAAIIVLVCIFGGQQINTWNKESCYQKQDTYGITTSYSFLNGGCKYYTTDGNAINNDNWFDIARTEGWLE